MRLTQKRLERSLKKVTDFSIEIDFVVDAIRRVIRIRALLCHRSPL